MKKCLSLGAALIALAGCSSNPLEVRRTSCPAVAVPKHTGSLTRFSSAGRYDAQDVQFIASIGEVTVRCVENAKGVSSAVSFTITAARPAKGAALDTQLPYFVAVIKDGETLIAKQVYGAALSFSDGATSSQIRQSVTAITPEVPLPPKPKKEDVEEFAPPPKPAVYEVLVGFQLSDTDAVYNITK